jgi:hypothetical protein
MTCRSECGCILRHLRPAQVTGRSDAPSGTGLTTTDRGLAYPQVLDEATTTSVSGSSEISGVPQVTTSARSQDRWSAMNGTSSAIQACQSPRSVRCLACRYGPASAFNLPLIRLDPDRSVDEAGAFAPHRADALDYEQRAVRRYPDRALAVMLVPPRRTEHHRLPGARWNQDAASQQVGPAEAECCQATSWVCTTAEPATASASRAAIVVDRPPSTRLVPSPGLGCPWWQYYRYGRSRRPAASSGQPPGASQRRHDAVPG